MFVYVSSVIASTVRIVLFFKQSTAYELRISDWSSDVCSSDLQPGHLGHHLVRGGQCHHRAPDRLADSAVRPGAPVRDVDAALRAGVVAVRILAVARGPAGVPRAAGRRGRSDDPVVAGADWKSAE